MLAEDIGLCGISSKKGKNFSRYDIVKPVRRLRGTFLSLALLEIDDFHFLQ